MAKDSSASSKASKAFENLAPLLGLGASLGAQVPGLRKAKKRDTAQKAARDTSMKAAGAAVGASQTGFGASRGLALRSGLRAAANIARQGAFAAQQGAEADEARYVAERDARNQRLAQFGKDVGDMAGQIGTGIVESRQAKEAEAAAGQEAERKLQIQQMQAMMPSMEDVLGIDPVTGLPAQQAPQEAAPQELQEIPVGAGPGLDQLDEYGEPMDGQMLPEPPGLDELGMDPALAELGIADKETLYSIAPELELQHRLENLALDEAYRTGTNINRIYARLRRLQNQPAINHTIDLNRQLQLSMPQMGGQ